MRRLSRRFGALLLCGALLVACRREPSDPVPPRATPDTTGAARRSEPELYSLLGRPLYRLSDPEQLARLEADLSVAQRELAANPSDPARTVWVGRRLGYLWRINEAVAVFSGGIAAHPDDAPLYRHRGHRYITLRQFDRAIADLERAAALIEGKPDEIEPDGMPNARNIPLTTTGFNVWYHLGVARYLNGDFQQALPAFERTLEFTRGYPDNLVAATDWLVLTLRRLGRDAQAAARLDPITPEMDIIENTAYHRRLLMYKGLRTPQGLLEADDAGPLDRATLGYGVGTWYLLNGQREKAVEVYRRVVESAYWPAFGFIAAEVELARLREL